MHQNPIIDNGRHRMNLPDAPIADEGFFATHFFTVRDQEKSRDFYVRILGGKLIKPENPCYIKLANTWIILNSGVGPTPDKPEVLLETPSNLNRVNRFLNLRVADIWACYKQWSDRGAFFLTEPLDNHGWELRCYLRDPAATSSRLANILKWRSTISTNTRVEKITNSFTSSVWADTGLTCRILQPNEHRPAVRFRRRQGVPMSLLVKARLIIIVLA